MIDKTTPIDEKTLTLYYYGDGLSDSERRRVEKAIREDDLLAARYATLSGELDGLREAVDIPAPEHLKHQWHELIEQQDKQTERWRAEIVSLKVGHVHGFDDGNRSRRLGCSNTGRLYHSE